MKSSPSTILTNILSYATYDMKEFKQQALYSFPNMRYKRTWNVLLKQNVTYPIEPKIEKRHNKCVLTTVAVVHNCLNFMSLLSPLSPPFLLLLLLPFFLFCPSAMLNLVAVSSTHVLSIDVLTYILQYEL